jgi:AhpD family alkylhydroperoxidase
VASPRSTPNSPEAAVHPPLALYAGAMDEGRSEHFTPWPDGYRTILSLSAAVRRSGLEAGLLELVKMRASQINGCAYCLDMHSKDARAAGESEQRLYALSAWRETTFYTDRERAALALTEAVTLIAETHAPLELVEAAAEVFSPDELEKLVYAIVEINAWNRLAVTTGAYVPGSYQPVAEGRLPADG